jgi:hypothetical protein
MSGPADEWEVLGKAFSAFDRHINQARTTNINAKSLREEARSVAHHYFRHVRPALLNVGLVDEPATLDASFQRLLELSNGNNASSSYKKEIKRIRKLMPRVSAWRKRQTFQAIPCANSYAVSALERRRPRHHAI